MKILIRIMMGLSLGMVIFNMTQVDWEYPLAEQSSIAIIGILAALCAFLLLLLLSLSMKISKKMNR
ncbi:MAG: hypothetical protein CMC22_06800 [Flavobacteriaceae bacterium]|nr:hypothetical protein [Flavobacteriaceae bacterium]|tara:strand:+ start:314 stop:511 length:198 start_codon:yes stop_codon:yes gene_type:complete